MNQGKLEALANKIWYGRSWCAVLLLPFSWLFALVAYLRRVAYQRGILRSFRLPVPIIIVGNITVGGTGKTPVTLYVTESLCKAGMVPAIISRGYGGKASNETRRVTAESDPGQVGDEPVLLAYRSGCPVYVNANRVAAARAAVQEGATVIVSDDGLQHYRLQRDAEIAVVDGERGLGNGYLLPAGPLREPESRLRHVHRTLVQGAGPESTTLYGNRKQDILTTRFWLSGQFMQNVNDESTLPVDAFVGQEVHAIAGIANPERFFRYLESLGIKVIPHPRADHAQYTMADIKFNDELNVVMTEKDAVKCRLFAHQRLWCLPVDATFDDGPDQRWMRQLHSKFSHAVRGAGA